MRWVLAIILIGLMASVAWATITTETTKNSYSCSGSVGPYTYGFEILEDDDLLVIQTDASGVETELVLNSDYTVSGTGDESGGTITLSSACPSGETLTLLRNMEYTQDTDYTVGGLFPAEAHEDALDKQVMLLQQMEENVGRMLRVQKSSVLNGSSLELTPTANEAVCFNSNATALVTCPAIPATAVLKADLINTSTGAEDAWKPIQLDADGHVDATMINAADIDHTKINGVGSNTHSQIDSHISNTTNPHTVTASQVGNTTAQWNADKIQGVDVDDADIADSKVLAYDSASGDLQYETVGGASSYGGSTFSAYMSVTNSVSATSWEKMSFDTEEWDSDSDYDSSSNYRFTPSTDGRYLVTILLKWRYSNIDPESVYTAAIYKNGSAHREISIWVGGQTPLSGENPSASVVAIVNANGSTDYFEAYAYNGGGTSSEVVGGAPTDSLFQASRIQ